MPTTDSTTSDLCLYILAIFLPPVSVFFKVGFGADFWINILLCILAFFPGIIHAWYVIYRSQNTADSGYAYTRTSPAPATMPATAPMTAPVTGTTGYGATTNTTGTGVTTKPAY